jgi:hypothetical protein
VRFELLEQGDVASLVYAPVQAAALRHLGGETNGLEHAGEWVFSPDWLAELHDDLRARIEAADPLDPGIPVPSEPWARAVLPLAGVERRGARLYLPGTQASLGGKSGAADAIQAALEESRFVPIPVEDRELAAYLEREGRLVRLGDGLAVGARAYEQARELLVEECEGAGSITLARFRDLLGTGRKPAQLLLERFDADGLTRRLGDGRVLRRRARTG